MFARGFRAPGGFPGRGYGPGLRDGFAPHPFFPFGPAIATLVTLVVLGLVVFALWRVFRKAGFEGAWSLVALVPVIGVPVALLVLALADWPVLACFRDERAAVAEPVPAAPGPAAAVPADVAETAPLEPAPPAAGDAPEEK